MAERPAPSAIERYAAALAGPGYAIDPGAIASAECADLVRALRSREAAGAFSDGGVGAGAKRVLRPDLRGDRICWLDEPYAPAESAILGSLDTLRVGLNRDLMLGLDMLELHYASYAPGRHYVRHLDRSPRGIERVITVILYLNEGWTAADGGELVLVTDAGEQVVAPQAGTFVTFLSDRFHHEVRAAGRERLSLTGWFSRRGSFA